MAQYNGLYIYTYRARGGGLGEELRKAQKAALLAEAVLAVRTPPDLARPHGRTLAPLGPCRSRCTLSSPLPRNTCDSVRGVKKLCAARRRSDAAHTAHPAPRIPIPCALTVVPGRVQVPGADAGHARRYADMRSNGNREGGHLHSGRAGRTALAGAEWHGPSWMGRFYRAGGTEPALVACYTAPGEEEEKETEEEAAANPSQESRRHKGSINRYNPDAEASRPQLASLARAGGKVREVASADASDASPLGEAAGPTVVAGAPSDSEPWPAFAGLPKKGDRIACWDEDEECYHEGELRPCLPCPVDGWMNLTTDDGEEMDVKITQARHEARGWRLVPEGEEGSVGSPSGCEKVPPPFPKLLQTLRMIMP